MNRTLTFGAVLLVIATLLSYWLLRGNADLGAASGLAPADEVRGTEPAVDETLVGLADIGESQEAEREVPVVLELAPAIDAEPTVEPGAADPPLAHLVGRLLTPDGAPAVGATLQVKGWGANSERTRRYGKPENWVDPSGTTDAEGRFDLEFDPPRAYQFVLDARLDGFAELSWRWSSLPPAEVTDVGDQTFIQSSTVSGAVLGADGKPTGIGWTVYADSATGSRGEGADSTRVRGPASKATGEFRLEGVAPGSVKLKAYSKQANWIDGPTLQLALGEDARAEILYDGPRLDRRISLTVYSRPFYAHDEIGDGQLIARSSQGAEYVGTKIQGSSQSYEINDLPDGSYTVEVNTAYHEPWSQSGVSLGDSLTARLKGSAALELSVTDDATGDAVEAYELRIRFDGANFSPATFDVHPAGKALPPGGRFEGLIPASCTAVVVADGYAPGEIQLGDLLPGESRVASVELSRGGTIRGRVLASGGAGAAGVRVLLHPHWPGYDPSDVFSGPRGMGDKEAFRDGSRETETAADGSFSIAGIRQGDFDVQAQRGPLQARQDQISIKSDEEHEIVLQLPSEGALRGRLLGFRAPPHPEVLVIAYPAGKRPNSLRGDVLTTSPVADDGGFVIEGLLAGAHEVALFVPRRQVAANGNSTQPCFAPLGSVEIAGAVTEITLQAGDWEPGAIEVPVLVNGAPAIGAVVTGRAMNESGAYFDVATVTDQEGNATLSPAFSGRYDLYVRSSDRSWSDVVKSAVEIGPGETGAFSFDVQMATGRLQVLDASTGLPASGRRVMVDGRMGLTTDEEGWVELTLTLGSHSLKTSWLPTADAEELTWGSTGALVPSVSMTFAD